MKQSAARSTKSGYGFTARLTGILAVIFIASIIINALPSFGASAESQNSYLAGLFGSQTVTGQSVTVAEPENIPTVGNHIVALTAVNRTVCAAGCDLATIADAVAEVNAGVPAGGVTYNVAAGHTETAPAGGYTITASGTATDQVIFQKSGAGANPTVTAPNPQTAGNLNDAIFKIVGGDYITISGFTMLENDLNTTTTAASNNMTEWGVAVLYATTTNGAQNVTLQNNTIDLNRTYQNTFGIYSNSTHSATAVTTSTSATTAAGANSGLKIYSNTITDVNNGIIVIGPTAAADNNDGLDIGGSVATANSLTNFGTTGTFSAYANVSGTVNGILVRNTKNFNVSYNTVTSSNGGHTVGATIRGIFVPSFSNAPTGTITNSINNNNVSVRSGLASAAILGIVNEATTVNATTTLNINNNDFNNFGHTVSGTGAITFISNAGTALNQNINNNTFTSISVNTTGTVNFIVNTNTLPTGGVKNVNNNSIVTGFAKTGAGGTVNLFTDNGSDPAGTTNNVNNNNFSNITLGGGAVALTGISNTNGGSPTKNVTGNTISNINTGGGTGTVSLYSINFDGGTTTVSNNIGSNVTHAGAINGILFGTSGAGTTNASQNTIHTLTGTGTGTVTGISVGGTSSTIRNVFRNKIYNLENSNAGGAVSGITVSTGTTLGVHNNLVGDLRTPAATSSNALIGISVTGGTTVNVDFNTVYLNATSTGATFGSSAISVSTTPTVTMRNNIFVNLSTPGSTSGNTVAYRRSTTTLTTYGSASNNNDFFAGTPAANRLIYFDSTNSDQTLAQYKARVTPRDSASISENPNFVSTNGADATFLHINTSTPTQLESGGIPISGITVDYDGETRNASTPDIGADEFTGTPLDLNPPLINYSTLGNSASTSNRTLTVTIIDVSGVAGGSLSPRVYFRKNGGAYFSTQCSMSGGTTQNGTWACTIDYSLVGGVTGGDVIDYFVVAQDVNGNVSANPSTGFSATDVNNVTSPPTNPNTYTVVTGTSGTFDVDASGPINSLTNAGGVFERLNNGVITGNIIVNINSDLTAETGAISLNQLMEEPAGSNFTVTIRPNGGAARLISGSNATVLINLNGADRVTFDGLNSGGNSLTIRNTGTGTGTVLRMINDASNNSVLNTTLEGGGSSAVLNISTGTTTGNDNIQVVGNTIRDRTDAAGVPFNSINLIGTSATVSNGNILINNNQIINFTQAGIVVNFSDNVTFTNNTIFQTATRTSALTGVAVNGATGTNLFSQNTIRDLVTSGATTAGNTTGMAFNDVRSTTVSRNRIYNFPSTSGSTGTLTGILFNGSSGNPASVTIVNNMVSIVTAFANAQTILGVRDFGFGGNTFNSYFNTVLVSGTGSGASNTYACQRGSGAPTVSTWTNNICFNNRTGGTGNHFAMGDSSDTTGTLTLNYNIYVGTGATPANFFDRSTSSTVNPVNFAAWQTGGRDANSQASNPGGNYTVANMFVSETDLHLNTSGTNPALDMGTAAGGVTIDFDGQTRPQGAAPEIGADEVAAVVTQPGTFQFDPTTYNVGEGAGTVTLTVTRTGGSDGAVDISYTLASSIAVGGTSCAAGVDFINTGGTVSFAAGQTTNTFTVPICEDAVVEGNESFTAQLTGATNGGTIGANAQATVTINDNDTAPAGTIQFSSATYSVGEDGGNATITVTRVGGSSGTVSANYSTANGTAVGGTCGAAGVDFTAQVGSISFTDGETADKTILIPICDDAVLENSETFSVTLSGSNVGSPATTTVTINDNEVAQPGTLQFNPTSYTIAEGNSGTSEVTLTVTRTGGSDGTVGVTYSTTNTGSTATAGTCGTGGADYANKNGQLTFAAGITTQTFNITICGDAVLEPDEVFNVALSSATGGATIGTNSGATVTITNDDAAGVTVTQTGNSTDVAEGGATDTYSIVLTSQPTSNVTITVSPDSQVSVNPTTLTFTTANWNTPQSVTVTAVDDNVFEGNHTGSITHSATSSDSNYNGISVAGVTVNITDNDTQPSVQFSAANFNAAENISGGLATITVTRSGATGASVAVNYATVSGGSATGNNACGAGVDYISTSGTLSFAAGETSKTFNVQICDDAAFEGNETVNLQLSTPTGATLGSQSTATLTILDNESPQPGSIQMGAENYTVGEGGGTVTVTFTRTGGSNGAVSANYSTANLSGSGHAAEGIGSCTAGADYVRTQGTVNFADGDTAPKSVSIPICEDTLVEPTEIFGIGVTSTTGGATIGNPHLAYVSITDNETPPTVQFSSATYSTNEALTEEQQELGSTGITITVTRSGNTSGESSVNYATSDGSATGGTSCGGAVDYITATGTLTFAANETTKNFFVQTCFDTVFEGNETINLALSSPTLATLGTPNTAVVTIVDNDAPPPSSVLQFNAANYEVDEGDGSVTITVTRSGDTSQAVTVNYATSNGTATGGSCQQAGFDYQTVSGTLSFGASETTKTFSFQICADRQSENPPETVNLTLSNPSNGGTIGSQGSAVVRIIDAAAQYANTTPIIIPEQNLTLAPAVTASSSLAVAGASVTPTRVRVTLFGLTHATPDDLDILLVSPTGQKFVVMGDAGGTNAANNVTLTFEDASGTPAPDSSALVSGSYKPANHEAGPIFDAPAPSGPYVEPGPTGSAASLNTTFNGDPNGTWTLYVRDDTVNGNTGVIAGGFGLEFIGPTSASATISGRVTRPNGQGVGGVLVSLVSPSGDGGRRFAVTSSFGYYTFENVPVGDTYILSATSKRYTFSSPSRVINLQEDVNGIDFITEQ